MSEIIGLDTHIWLWLIHGKFMQTTTYKGYTGKFELDFEDNLISGLVIDIKDVITFHGHTIEEAIKCFHESVDDYLDFCQELGEEPEKPFNSYDYHIY